MYNLRIHLNLSIRTSDPKFNLPNLTCQIENELAQLKMNLPNWKWTCQALIWIIENISSIYFSKILTCPSEQVNWKSTCRKEKFTHHGWVDECQDIHSTPVLIPPWHLPWPERGSFLVSLSLPILPSGGLLPDWSFPPEGGTSLLPVPVHHRIRNPQYGQINTHDWKHYLAPYYIRVR